MPYCWDGHDNASHIQETGYGLKLERYTWSDGDIEQALVTMRTDKAMQERLTKLARHMQAEDGRRKGAEALDKLLRETAQ
jgi:UDP:flavonoid glycosyltransferase YjiC (YdhE family)